MVIRFYSWRCGCSKQTLEYLLYRNRYPKPQSYWNKCVSSGVCHLWTGSSLTLMAVFAFPSDFGLTTILILLTSKALMHISRRQSAGPKQLVSRFGLISMVAQAPRMGMTTRATLEESNGKKATTSIVQSMS